MPVASCHNLRVAAGSASPADTHLRRLDRSCCAACSAIARYAVGDVKHTVARYDPIAAASASGPAFSTRTQAAPMLIGNNSRPPSPKVNASGGLPMKTSLGAARSTCRGQQAQAAITSRWKCIAAFGWPVVPEVKAMMQVSSAAVSTLAKLSGLAAIAASSPLPAAPLNSRNCVSVGHCARANSSSSANRASTRACVISALATMVVSSRARSRGIVPTAMPPALTTPNQHAANIGLLAPRSSTRLPGTRPMSSTSTRAMRLARRCSSA